ncbi:MAG: hypothetical protein E7070_09230 [Bacteroidales bacterium]|jgi:hypothetical protein|nr:hypothetical protein [Bacteroidales bacterium]
MNVFRNNKFRKFCLYYKGESENPFEHGWTDALFWELEFQYLKDLDSTEWEVQARNYIKNNQDKKNYMTDPDVPIENKGFVMFAEAMLEKWLPLDVHLIFEYGKKRVKYM